MTAILLDEMYPPSLAQRHRDKAHDVVAVLEVEVGLASRSDEDVLAWAGRNQRCVITENVADFARLAALGATHGASCSCRPSVFPEPAAVWSGWGMHWKPCLSQAGCRRRAGSSG